MTCTWQKVFKSCADGTLLKEIGRPSANEQNCVGKCTTFRDQTLNFLIDKYSLIRVPIYMQFKLAINDVFDDYVVEELNLDCEDTDAIVEYSEFGIDVEDKRVQYHFRGYL